MLDGKPQAAPGFPGRGLTRRAMLAGTAAAGSLPVLAGCSPTESAAAGTDRLTRTVGAAFDAAARRVFEVDPEATTRLGLLGRGAPDWTHGQLSPRSQASFERSRLDRIEALRTLSELPLASAGSRLRTHQLAIKGAYERAVAIQAYGFGRVSLSDASPYVADHLGGGYLDVPRLLLSRQPLSTAGEAEAYLSRLAALAPVIRDEQRRLEADAAAGIVPPRPVLSRLAARAALLADLPAEGHPLLRDLANRTVALDGLSDEARQAMLVAASRLLAGELPAAYRSLAGSAGRLFETASDLPGLAALNSGPAYYDTLLKTRLLNQTRLADLRADLDERIRGTRRRLETDLAAIELTTGALADRRAALEGLNVDPELTPAGLADRLTSEMDRMRPRLRQVVARLPAAEAVVVMSPERLWASYDHDDMTYEPAAADGHVSGTLRVRPALAALGAERLLPAVHREGLPGRHLARAMAIEDSGQPLLRQLTHPLAFAEAWSAYGLDLAAEFAPGDAPAARAFRRFADLDLLIEAMVDLGIHGLDWTREEALGVMREAAGLGAREAVDRLWRIAVQPGRAIAAVFGRAVFRALRERAAGRLGNDFDPAAFHYTLLSAGPRPFAQVQAEMEDWTRAQSG